MSFIVAVSPRITIPSANPHTHFWIGIDNGSASSTVLAALTHWGLFTSPCPQPVQALASPPDDHAGARTERPRASEPLPRRKRPPCLDSVSRAPGRSLERAE